MTVSLQIDAIIEKLIGVEGGYSNNPNDHGGPTRWGITLRVAHDNGYDGDMRYLPRDRAKAIYLDLYVNKPGFAAVAAVSPIIADELVDTGANMGPDVPARWLQEWLNALNNQATLYPDIKEDADIGNATISALKALIAKRGSEGQLALLRGLNCSQGARYKDLARGRVKNEAFVFGWLKNRVGL